MEKNGKSFMKSPLAAFLPALAIIIIIIIVFKMFMMPKDERYKRSCMQGVSSVVLKNGAAIPADFASGPKPRPFFYRSFPWYTESLPPKNKMMNKVWKFCTDSWKRETHSHQIYGVMINTVEGQHGYDAARLVLEHIDKGWGIGPGIPAQRTLIKTALNEWGVHGHDENLQSLLEKYNAHITEDKNLKTTLRIVNKGTFEPRDLCAQAKYFNKAKIASDPAKLLATVGCK